MKFAVIAILLLAALRAEAQQSDSQLAYAYYQAKEYDKAAEKFLRLYERTRSANFLDYYIICLINAKQYDKAENELKKFLKADDSNKDFLINLGYIYQQQGKSSKSEECFEKAVKKLIPQQSDINNLAAKFKNIREYGWAIRAYQQGRALLKKPNAFLKELGDCYLLERDYENMMALFARSLELNPESLNSIVAQLGYARTYDIANNVDPVIEKTLAERCKQRDCPPVFDELAVWYASQQHDYAQALRHAVLLDGKAENKANVFMNIARDAANNGQYAIAEQAYQKVIDKGKEKNNFYLPARKGALLCRYDQIRQHPAEEADYASLAGECEQYVQEFGYGQDHVDVIALLSDLYAYRLQQPDTANRILERAAQLPRLTAETRSLLKSRRADLLAFMGNPWEATILYTQVEKANPNNDTGYEAKLKKARTAYYAGDLLWAKAQFDVLKGATSKLVSNDAIQMSHFIDMSYLPDEANEDLEKMARAEYLLYRRQFAQALPALDSLMEHAAPEIADRAALQKAGLLAEQFRYEEAARLLERLQEQSEQTCVKAEALFKLAEMKRKQNEIPQARELYKQLVTDYSGSVYSVEAGKLYRDLEKP